MDFRELDIHNDFYRQHHPDFPRQCEGGWGERKKDENKPEDRLWLLQFFLVLVDLHAEVQGHPVRLSNPVFLLSRHSTKRKDGQCLL